MPTARSYITATTDRPATEISTCIDAYFDDVGTGDVTPTDYGQRLDFRFRNIGGSAKEPSISIELYDGEQRTLIMYGFGTWRGAIKSVWRDTAKKCFPELGSATVVKAR